MDERKSFYAAMNRALAGPPPDALKRVELWQNADGSWAMRTSQNVSLDLDEVIQALALA